MAVFRTAWYTQLLLFRMLLVYLIPTRHARPLSLSTVTLVCLPPQINLGHVTPTCKPTRLWLHAAHSGLLHYKSCQFRPSTRSYWISTKQNTTAFVLNKSSTYSFSVYLLYKSWMCVDFSCKTSFFKCCCFLFDGTDVWESSMLDYFCCAIKSWVNDWLIMT